MLGSDEIVNGSETIRIRLERRDAAENRQRILKAALKLFEQYGVEQVSMNQIINLNKILINLSLFYKTLFL
jgi:hypothetical protein